MGRTRVCGFLSDGACYCVTHPADQRDIFYGTVSDTISRQSEPYAKIRTGSSISSLPQDRQVAGSCIARWNNKFNNAFGFRNLSFILGAKSYEQHYLARRRYSHRPRDSQLFRLPLTQRMITPTV